MPCPSDGRWPRRTGGGDSGLAHDLSEWETAYGRFEVALRALDEFRDDHRALDRAAYRSGPYRRWLRAEPEEGGRSWNSRPLPSTSPRT